MRTCRTFLVNIVLPNRVAFIVVPVTEAPLTGNEDMLIGMDIITAGDFVITNKNKKTVFSFRTPSNAVIDFVQEHKTKSSTKKIGRNQLCPCGSGKKYKKCCGS